MNLIAHSKSLIACFFMLIFFPLLTHSQPMERQCTFNASVSHPTEGTFNISGLITGIFNVSDNTQSAVLNFDFTNPCQNPDANFSFTNGASLINFNLPEAVENAEQLTPHLKNKTAVMIGIIRLFTPELQVLTFYSVLDKNSPIALGCFNMHFYTSNESGLYIDAKAECVSVIKVPEGDVED